MDCNYSSMLLLQWCYRGWLGDLIQTKLSPLFESSSLLCPEPSTCTSSMLELIMQGMQQKYKSPTCDVKKTTWHTEPNYILQHSKYVIVIGKRFRYINNNVTEGRCSIPMDMTSVFGLCKFSPQATIDYHGPSMYSGHSTPSINCWNKRKKKNDSKITDPEMYDAKNSSTAYVVMYKLIT